MASYIDFKQTKNLTEDIVDRPSKPQHFSRNIFRFGLTFSLLMIVLVGVAVSITLTQKSTENRSDAAQCIDPLTSSCDFVGQTIVAVFCQDNIGYNFECVEYTEGGIVSLRWKKLDPYCANGLTFCGTQDNCSAGCYNISEYTGCQDFLDNDPMCTGGIVCDEEGQQACIGYANCADGCYPTDQTCEQKCGDQTPPPTGEPTPTPSQSCNLELRYIVNDDPNIPNGDEYITYNVGDGNIALSKGDRVRLRADVSGQTHPVRSVNYVVNQVGLLDIDQTSVQSQPEDAITPPEGPIPAGGAATTRWKDYNPAYRLKMTMLEEIQYMSTYKGTISVNVKLDSGIAGTACSRLFKFRLKQAEEPTPPPSLAPSPSASSCSRTGDWRDADINQDLKVNIQDFAMLQAEFGKKPPTNCRVDINRDGVVNIQDFSILQNYFGYPPLNTSDTPAPSGVIIIDPTPPTDEM